MDAAMHNEIIQRDRQAGERLRMDTSDETMLYSLKSGQVFNAWLVARNTLIVAILLWAHPLGIRVLEWLPDFQYKQLAAIAVYVLTIGFWVLQMTYSVVYVALYRNFVTSQRVVTHKGILTRSYDTLEMFRIRDVKLVKPLIFRIVGRSNVMVYTTDRTNPTLNLAAIKNGEEVMEAIRDQSRRARAIHGVHVVE